MFEDDQSKEQGNKEENKSLFDDKLNEIKNEKGEPKYDSLEKALDALKNSQEFIPKLEEDNKKLRSELENIKSELEKRASVEDVLTKVLSEKDSSEKGDKGQPSENHLSEESLKEVVDKLLESRLTEAEKTKKKEDNKLKVKKAFTEIYGESAGTEFKKLAESIGQTPESLTKLAEDTPDLILKVLNKSKGSSGLNTSGINTSNFFDKKEEDYVKPSSKSVLAGASTKDLRAEMQRHKELIYKKYNISQ